MKLYALSLALGLLIANGVMAADKAAPPATCTQVQGTPNCCAHCGQSGECQKTCKIVCEMKEVKKTVWAVHCSEFCTTMPNLGRKCNSCGECAECNNQQACAEPNCADCNGGTKCDPCESLNNRRYVTPDCGRVREKKTLEKKEVVCKVPVYKCVVVYSCNACGSGEKPAEVKGTESQPAPAPAPAPKSTQNIPLSPIAPGYATR